MIYVFKFITNLILPPGCFIILLIALGVLQYKREKRLPKLALIVVVLIYITSIPLTANFIIHSLEYKFNPPSKLEGDVIVMLGGGASLSSPDISGIGSLSGSSANRLLTTARLHNKTKLPIIISGGSVYGESGTEAEIAKRQLIDLGLDEKDIIQEDKSRTTTENALYTSKLMEEHHFSKPILVTSAFHMERSIINFTNANIKNAIPYPADYFTNAKLTIGFESFVPNSSSFDTTVIALHEYLGMLQLWIKSII
ncbi:YdcF family protein [Clostridium sp. YIM B02505]|uniref:YdcF family protein n=1 Tax=Clostridium yunnanense TaxID=2800325 RepID=A0ABS1EWW2_9CLOT|nr:YdcF family protein [Clostridium yunnanense]MBK1813876.1 YdcF family protein [Clostridium yunnanense]